MIDGHGDDLYGCGTVRMNFSSNIYAHADLSALEEHLRRCVGAVRHYPEPRPRELERRLAGRLGLKEGQVLVTSGATEAIYLVAQAFSDEKTFTVSHPTFSEYGDACRMFGCRETDDGALGWLCNPNNPTGEVLGTETVREWARRYRWLVVDQSYEDYTLQRLLSPPEAVGMGNVILLHSMTKRYAVPGLRLGYVTAPETVIERLRRCCRPWAVNALAVEAGRWLLERPWTAVPPLGDYLAEAGRLRGLLNDIGGIQAFDSHTHFFLCTTARGTAAELKQWLLAVHGILIRDASNFGGLSPRHFRIAAQRPEENDALAAAIREYMERPHVCRDFNENMERRT